MSRGGAIALGLLALAVASCGRDEGGPQVEAGTARPSAPEDPRLAWLLEPFPRDSYYDVDTSDTVGVLVAALTHGHRDPLKAARIQLAEEGPAGVEAARRVIERAWNNPDRFNDIRNALDVLSYSKEPNAHEEIGKVLGHPAPVPRQAAWRALRVHPDPRWYDDLRELFDIESPELQMEIALTLHDLDPARAEDEFTTWIADGRFQGLWGDLGPRLAASTHATTRRRACSLSVESQPRLDAMLTAACAKGGDSEALERLRGWQRSEKPIDRRVAVEAFANAGFPGELAWTLERDPDIALRRLAAQTLATAEGDEDFTELLRAGTSDADPEVAQMCLRRLLDAGDPDAIEEAFGQLTSTLPGAREAAVKMLAGRWLADPALARRCFEHLVLQHDQEAHRALALRQPVVRAIGMLPLLEAAQWLDELPTEGEDVVQGLPADRWVVLQIGNTGDAGQRHLVDSLAEETDLLRRLDRIEALSARTTELSRGWLLARAEEEGVPPYELLYLADRLTRMGPAKLVAPVLKRATLRVEQEDVRRALQGLLWMWFPAPDEHS